MKDEFGDRMKDYEGYETHRRFLPLVPVYVRLDGRGFSKFTRGMSRPFDTDMSRIMQETTNWVVEQAHARTGYTQSDEISILFHSDSADSQIFYNGKIQKMVSVLASMASVKFNSLAREIWPERVDRMMPVFDCRAFVVPSKIEAVNTFLWREKDATKNAVSMVARSFYSHKKLQHKSTNTMKDMLLHEKGVNFENDYPSFFRHGTFFVRRTELYSISEERLEQIPPEHRSQAAEPKLRQVLRGESLDCPFLNIQNKIGFLFDGADPIRKDRE